MTQHYADMAERLWLNSAEPDDGSCCRIWLCRCTKKGYGRITYRVKGKVSPVSEWVHRVSYRIFIGPIPPGMEIDHTCERENCIAPWHLEAVTPDENLNRKRDRLYSRKLAHDAGLNVVTEKTMLHSEAECDYDFSTSVF